MRKEPRPTRYAGYTGARKYSVLHPQWGSVIVTAPDSCSAIVAAATYWQTPWTEYSFYAACEVARI